MRPTHLLLDRVADKALTIGQRQTGERFAIGILDLNAHVATGTGREVDDQLAAGELHREYSPPLSPDITKVPHQVVWRERGEDLMSIDNSGFMPVEPGKFRLDGEHNGLVIPVRSATKFSSASNYVLSLRMAVSA